MHYFKWRISDYASHTQHLDESEDLAYRRMLDWYYLHESPLPESVDQIARLIRMRTQSEAIANVLQEFFELGEYGYIQKAADKEINAYKAKSEKAKASAAARWSAKPNKSDANALRDECEGNANHKPLTNNHKPDIKEKAKRFVPPSIQECIDYFLEKGSTHQEANNFFNYYESNGWKVGKNKMQKWKSSASGWISRQSNFNQQQTPKPSQGSLEDLLTYGDDL